MVMFDFRAPAFQYEAEMRIQVVMPDPVEVLSGKDCPAGNKIAGPDAVNFLTDMAALR